MSNKDSKIQFPEIRVVEASAGSGKTYALAMRCLKLLFHLKREKENFPLSQILAITFTKKATAEMRARIIEFLKIIALDAYSSDDQRKFFETELSAKTIELSLIASELLDDIYTHYDSFGVQTIDSFVKALISGCSYFIGLSAYFKITHDFKPHLERSFDELVDAASSNPQTKLFFEEFVDQYLFVDNRRGWNPKKDILSILKDLVSVYSNFKGELKPHSQGYELIIATKKNVLKQAQELNSLLPEIGVHQTARKHFDKFIGIEDGLYDIDSIPKCLTISSKQFFTSKANPSSECELKLNRVREAVSQLAELEATTVFNAYVQLYNATSKILSVIAAEQDLVFVGDLNKQAQKVFLNDEINKDEIFLRLSSRYRHFLIDEFQDTSRLQWANFFPLIDEALSIGGTLFYVGDKKQAIYRFRGGDNTLFNTAANDFLSSDKIVDVLDTNYRSGKNIVDFNNRLFSKNNLIRFLSEYDPEMELFKQEDINSLVSIYASVEQNPKFPDGYVEWKTVDGIKKEDIYENAKIEVDIVLDDVRQRFDDKDIALLVRTKDEARFFTEMLISKDIKVDSERTLNVKDNLYVCGMVDFLRFLSSPIDDRAFTAYVTNELFLSVSEITADDIQDFLLEYKTKDESKTSYLYRAFMDKFPLVWSEFIQPFFRSSGLVPLYELLVSIYEKYRVEENFIDASGFFAQLLELVRISESEHSDITDFVEFYDGLEEELFVKHISSNAVTVMTIHKAKGLDFKVVIIPALKMSIKPAGKENFHVNHQDDGMSLYRLKEKYSDCNLKLADKARQHKVRAFEDEMNTLYVALTRPRKELYCFIPPKADASKNPALMLFESDEGNIGSKSSKSVKNNQRKLGLNDSIAPSYRPWLAKLKDEFDRSLVSDSRAKEIGDLCHAILEGIKVKEDIEKIEVLAKELDKEHAISILCVDKVKNLLSDQKVKSILFNSGKVEIEKEFVDKYGDLKRVDRIMFKGKQITLLDYKQSTKGKDKHIKQIKEYSDIIMDVYQDYSLKAYLVYIDEIKAEEVNV